MLPRKWPSLLGNSVVAIGFLLFSSLAFAGASAPSQLLRLKRQISPDLPFGASCTSIDKNPGACVSLKECPRYALLDKFPVGKAILAQAVCGASDTLTLYYCCPGRAPIPLTDGTSDKITKKVYSEEDRKDFKELIRLVGTLSSGALFFPRNCGKQKTSRNRISGGVIAEKYSWPWIALLGYRFGGGDPIQWKCGGSLITQRHVLTAGHCIHGELERALRNARLGEYDLSTTSETSVEDFSVRFVIPHPEFARNRSKNADIGIVVLATQVQFKDTISPICLPFDTNARSKDYTYAAVWAAGWGKLNSADFENGQILREVQLTVWSNRDCARAYFDKETPITDKHLCANRKGGGDTCKGDSGGPLIVPGGSRGDTHYQIGVVAFGHLCGLETYPGVYTRVTEFLDWIGEVVEKTFNE